MQTAGGLWYEVTELVAPWAEDGGPVLFHHGVGITGDVWLEWLPVLADRHRLVRFDMRGFGRSAREWRAFVERHGMAAWSAMMMEHRADPARVPEASRRWYERVQAESSAGATLGLTDALIGTDFSAELPALRVPTLILAPGASPFIPLDVALDLQARIPASEIRVFPGVRHAIVHSHGRACAEAVRDFLERRGA